MKALSHLTSAVWCFKVGFFFVHSMFFPTGFLRMNPKFTKPLPDDVVEVKK